MLDAIRSLLPGGDGDDGDTRVSQLRVLGRRRRQHLPELRRRRSGTVRSSLTGLRTYRPAARQSTAPFVAGVLRSAVSDASDSAAYAFEVTFRLDPDVAGVRTDPSRFETTVYRRADPPGEEGWLFFRDNLWRGGLASPEHFRERTEAALGVPVESVSFLELRTDPEYRSAMDAAVAARPDAFNESTPELALANYLGSSIRVVDDV